MYSIASIVLQRLGIPLPPIMCIFKTIQSMDHYVRTAFSDSESKLDSIMNIILNQGILSGNGCSLTTWIVDSSTIINTIKQLKHEIQIVSAMLKEKSKTIGFVFIDDTDLTAEKLYPAQNEIEEVANDMQEAIDTWEGCLKTTGRAIRPDKSFVYQISFYFEKQALIDLKQ